MPDKNGGRRRVDDGRRRPLVLIVDDEPLNLDLLEQELAGQDLEIQTASNGQEAMACLAERPPDMVFLDLMMPVMDGFGVLEALQAEDAWREIPVVIISASSDIENIVRGIGMGAVDFLPKPFEPAILQARLEAGLEKKRLRDLEQRYLQSLERELEIGREIQAGFLPRVIPQPEGWKIATHFQAAREVAGDFYDVFEMGDGKLGLLLGDVTDKGVGSALYMALYRSLLRAAVMSDSLTASPDRELCTPPEACIQRAVTLVNHYICEMHDTAMFATLFFGVLDTASGRLCYVNAGHDPPYLLRASAALERIQPTGPVVGVMQEAEYAIGTRVLESGESLLLYSDGVPDARDAAGEMFGAERLERLLQQSHPSPEQGLAALIASLEGHIAQAARFDDITCVMVSRAHGSAKPHPLS